MGAATSIIFVTMKVLLWQAPVFHDKHLFVMTKHVFCRDKSMLVTTHFCCDKYLSQQQFLLRQKYFVVTNINFLLRKFCCGNLTFVTTKDVFCHDKRMFVATEVLFATKMILVAALADDRDWPCGVQYQCLALWRTMPVLGCRAV